MKKLPLALCIILFAMSCRSGRQGCTPPNSNTKPISLNGLDSVTALKMIDNFNKIKSVDKTPLPASIWISSVELHDMIILLEAERDSDIAHRNPKDTDRLKGLTDGVRVYFACDTMATNPHNSTSIIITSTKDNGKSTSPDSVCLSGRRHLDYYTHSLNFDLFKIGDIEGEICNGGPACVGDSLYIPSKNPSDRVDSKPYSLSRKKAEKMVQNFYNHPINTEGEWFNLSELVRIDQDPKYDGIRFYFATNDKGSNPEFSGKDCFIITTTAYSKQIGAYVDYFNTSGGTNTIASPQDNGELCPTNCN
jgi:hypothetical protein